MATKVYDINGKEIVHEPEIELHARLQAKYPNGNDSISLSKHNLNECIDFKVIGTWDKDSDIITCKHDLIDYDLIFIGKIKEKKLKPIELIRVIASAKEVSVPAEICKNWENIQLISNLYGFDVIKCWNGDVQSAIIYTAHFNDGIVK